MRATAEISKISLGIKSYFAILQVLQQSSLYSSPFSVKYFTASAFGISFLI